MIREKKRWQRFFAKVKRRMIHPTLLSHRRRRLGAELGESI